VSSVFDKFTSGLQLIGIWLNPYILLTVFVFFNGLAIGQDAQVFEVDLISKGKNYSGQLLQTAGQRPSAEPAEVTFRFTGDMQFRLEGQRGDSILFQASIRSGYYTLSGPATTDFADTSGLGRPLYFSWCKGRIFQVWIHESSSSAVAATVRMLLGYLQYPVTDRSQLPTELLQDDLMGHCVVHYSLQGKGPQTDTIHIQKKRYQLSADEWDDNALKTVYTPASSLVAVVKDGCFFPVQVEGADTLTTRLAGKMIGYSYTLFSITAKDSNCVRIIRDTDKNEQFSYPEYNASAIYNYQSPGNFRLEIRKQILGNDRLPGLTQQLCKLKPEDDADSLSLKLKSLATVFPETAYPLAAMLDTASPQRMAYQLLSGALLYAGTSQAQHAVSALIWKHRNDWTYSKKLLTGMGMQTRVTDSSIGYFKQLALFRPMSPVSKTAWLALGAMNDQLSQSDSINGDLLWKWIRDSLQTLNEKEGGTRMKLLVWGNSNQPAAFDSVTRYIRSSDEELRALSVIAASQFAHPGKINLLLDVLRTDTLVMIRTSAGRGLSGLLSDEEHLDQLAGLFRQEKDSTIRVLLVNALDINSPNRMKMRALLEPVFSNEQTWSVRLAAGDLLRRIRELE